MKQKKVFRSSVSLLLAVLLLASIAIVPASAENRGGSEEFRQFDSMLTIGTSMIRGYGFGDYDDYTMNTAHGFNGNTPDFVAKAVGANRDNCYLAAIAGETVTMPLWLLGLVDPSDDYLCSAIPSHRGSRYDSRLKPVFGKDVGGPEDSFSFAEIMKSSELIVIELGLGDTVFRAKEIALKMIDDGDSILSAASELIKQLFDGFEYFKSRFPMLLDYIKKNNKEAEVVLVGTANFADGITITDKGLLPVGNALDVIFDSLNAYIKCEAKEYGFKYADVSKTEMRAKASNLSLTNDEFLSKLDYYLHPSDAGMKYMADQILNQLKADKPIEINLNSAKSVESVLVDAKTVKNYSLDGDTLTVNVDYKTAKLLTVTYVKENGATYSSTYKLSYDDGYTASKTISAIVAGPFATSAFTAAFSFFQSIGSFFKGLFK